MAIDQQAVLGVRFASSTELCYLMIVFMHAMWSHSVGGQSAACRLCLQNVAVAAKLSGQTNAISITGDEALTLST